MKKKSKFTLFSEDDKHFLIHDGEAHFPVAKKALSEDQVKQIKKYPRYQHFADGGEVEKVDGKVVQKLADAGSVLSNEEAAAQAASTQIPLVGAAGPDTVQVTMPSEQPVMPPVPEAFRRKDPNAIEGAEFPLVPDTLRKRDEDLFPEGTNPIYAPGPGPHIQTPTGLVQAEYNNIPEDPDKFTLPNFSGPRYPDKPVLPGKPTEIPEAAPPTPEAAPIPGPADPPKEKPEEDPYLKLLKGYDDAYKMKVAGANAKAKAATAVGLAAANAEQNKAQALEAGDNLYKRKLADLEAQASDIYKDIKDNPARADRYWGDKSTGQKIGGAIAIMLGGLGGGLDRTHGNVALDIINKAIHNDLKAQEININSKHSLFNHNLLQTKNLMDARTITLAQLNAIAAAKIAQATGANAGTAADGIRKETIGQLMEEAAKRNMEFALTNSIIKMSTDPKLREHPDTIGEMIDRMAAANPERAKPYQQRFVNGEGLASGVDVVPQSDRDQITELKHAMEAAKNLVEYNNLYSSTLPLTPELIRRRQEGKAMALLSINHYREATGQGTPTKAKMESDAALINENPTALFSEIFSGPGYKKYYEDLHNKLTGIRKKYRFPVKNSEGALEIPFIVPQKK